MIVLRVLIFLAACGMLGYVISRWQQTIADDYDLDVLWSRYPDDGWL